MSNYDILKHYTGTNNTHNKYKKQYERICIIIQTTKLR